MLGNNSEELKEMPIILRDDKFGKLESAYGRAVQKGIEPLVFGIVAEQLGIGKHNESEIPMAPLAQQCIIFLNELSGRESLPEVLSPLELGVVNTFEYICKNPL